MRESKRVEFVRALIAAAWADGAISYQEMNSLKEYMQQLDLTNEECSSLEPYLEDIIEAKQAAQLIEDFLVNARKSERETLVAAIRDMVLVDGRLSSREEEFLSLFEEVAQEVSTPTLFVNSLKQVWERSEPPAAEDTGEFQSAALVDVFYKNRVLYEVKRKLQENRGSLELDETVEAELRRLCAIGALLGRVANADEVFDDDERQKIAMLLHQASAMRRTDIDLIVDIIRAEVEKGLDYLPFVREFAETASAGDREDILELLFKVAGADGQIGHAESEEFRLIAKALGISHRAFINARVKAAPKPR